jgi:hypothetical protein
METVVIGPSTGRVVVCVLGLAAALSGHQAVTQPVQYFPPLSTDASRVWGQYLMLTEQRMATELSSPKGFLVLDFTPAAAADRQSALAGQIPVAELATLWPNHTSINVPDNWVHHWRGAVFIPGVRLDHVFARLQEAVPGTGQGDVIKSSIVRDGPRFHTFMQVQRSGSFAFIDYHLVYNTEHIVEFTRRSPVRGTSATVATKIAELYHPGTPEEHEFAAGKDNGFLRRWNSYWRYEEIGSGVIAECEAVTLSRSAPYLIGALGARSIAESAARESIEHALVSLRTFFRTPPAPLPAR